MIKNDCFIKFINDKKLRDIGFRYISSDDIYVNYFPIDKYHGYTTLKCRVIIRADSKDVYIDVLDGNNQIYSPYYTNTNSAYDEYINHIHNEIFAIFRKCGIFEKKKIFYKRNKRRSYGNRKYRKA